MSENKENKEQQENNVVPIRPELEEYAEHGGLKKRPTKRVLQIIFLAFFVILVICLLVFGSRFGNGRIKHFYSSLLHGVGDDVTYQFDDGQKNVYAAYQNSLAVVTGYGLTAFDAAGEELGTIQHSYTTPLLQAGKQLVMVCDIGSNRMTLMDSAGDAVLELTSEGTFLDANISNGDTVCSTEIMEGYKAVLSVYDSDQNRIFRWYSSTSYFNQCAVSADASYLCAIRLGNSGNTFESTAVLFSTTAEDPIAEVPLGDQMINEVQFINSSTIAIIGEHSTILLSRSGEVLNEYDYHAAYLRDYSVSYDGFIALSLNMYQAGNQYSVVTLNPKGEKLAEQYVGEEISAVSAAGDYCAVLTPSQLLIYDKSLTLCASDEELQSVSSVLMLEDGAVILLGGGSGTLTFLQ